MKSSRRYKVTILSLLTAVILALFAAVMLLTGVGRVAYAGDTPRYVQLNGSTAFYSDNIRGAEITSWKGDSTKAADGDNTVDHYYTLFKMGNNQTVSYRQNLAYSWKTGIVDNDGNYGVDDGEYFGKGYVDNTFSMEIGFVNCDFEKFTVRFQSQQYAYTDGNITENYLVFTVEGGKLYLSVVKDVKDEDEHKVELGSVSGEDSILLKEGEALTKIKIWFGTFANGEYPINVSVNGVDKTNTNQTFKNVYESYANYVSSGDLAVTPLQFGAEFKAGEDGVVPATANAQMVLFSVNNQQFELYDSTGSGSYDRVKDTAAPVLCFTSTPSYLEYGKTIGFNYKTIDVLAGSPRTTPYYYVLTGSQYESNEFGYDKTYQQWEDGYTAPDDATDKTNPDDPYIKVTSTSSFRIIKDDQTFIPNEYIGMEDGHRVYGLVKMYFEISDVSSDSSTAQKDVVFISWYAKPSALVDIYELKNNPGKTSYFLKLVDGNEGVTLASATDDDEEDYKLTVKNLQTAYQQKIDDAIAALKDDDGNVVGKLFAGSDNKFYLPAIDWSFPHDEFNSAQDYKYSIFFKTSGSTDSSSKSLAYNKLSINLTEAYVTYYFRLYITDAFGSPMRYPVGNGEWEEIKESDVWDSDYSELLPEFGFEVNYKTATSENPDDLALAYVGTTYSGVSFSINGVSGMYNTTYNLYLFDRNALYSATGVRISYEDMVGKITVGEKQLNMYEALFGNLLTFGDLKKAGIGIGGNDEAETLKSRKYFTTVKPVSSLVEGDKNYELFKSIAWNATNVSFVPQSIDDFYVVELVLSDKNDADSVNSYYAYVAPSTQTTSLAGESDWIEKNVTSVVLLSVAGVCLVALIILLIVKPKDKGDVDAIYTDITANDGGKKSKKSKKQDK